ncbi:MAG: DeoR/GlpR family DNA-binding transcription regulator [Anaerolineae bacterium]
MLGYERREYIRQLISARHQASVVELSELLGVSASTIRRDLARMERAELLERQYGGASAPATRATPEPPLWDRTSEQAEEKHRIGQAAATLIHDGETIFIGGGTTTPGVAHHVRGKRGLTVFTNAWKIAQILIDDPEITLVLVGGIVRRSELSFVGPLAEQALREVRADKVILGIRAIHPQFGLTNDGLMETQTDRSIVRCAPEVIVVADHTKFGRVAPSFVAPVSAMHVLVTDQRAPADVLAELSQAGVRVIRA